MPRKNLISRRLSASQRFAFQIPAQRMFEIQPQKTFVPEMLVQFAATDYHP